MMQRQGASSFLVVISPHRPNIHSHVQRIRELLSSKKVGQDFCPLSRVALDGHATVTMYYNDPD